MIPPGLDEQMHLAKNFQRIQDTDCGFIRGNEDPGAGSEDCH